METITKKVKVKGSVQAVQFAYDVDTANPIHSLTWKKQTKYGEVVAKQTLCPLTFYIDGKKYEGQHLFQVSGGPYTEKFVFNGVAENSHKKAIEYLLAVDGEKK
jgi:hypothetical protein